MAGLFYDAIKGGIATLKLGTSDERVVADILNNIDVRQQKESVRIRFEVKIEEIETLMEKKDKLVNVNITEAFRTGCEAYIVKPVKKEKLLEEMKNLGLIKPEKEKISN